MANGKTNNIWDDYDDTNKMTPAKQAEDLAQRNANMEKNTVRPTLSRHRAMRRREQMIQDLQDPEGRQ